MDVIKNTIIEVLQNTKREGIDKLIAYMEENGFFVAPCSSEYHLCCEGGLAKHSLNVYVYAKKLADDIGVEIPAESLAIAALLHDLGKMGGYGKPNYVENVLKSGKVSEAKPYRTNPDLLYKPHEARSVDIAKMFIALTEEEDHAIYYHNGKYTHIGYDLHETKLQCIVHWADLWVSRFVEVEE